MWYHTFICNTDTSKSVYNEILLTHFIIGLSVFASDKLISPYNLTHNSKAVFKWLLYKITNSSLAWMFVKIDSVSCQFSLTLSHNMIFKWFLS